MTGMDTTPPEHLPVGRRVTTTVLGAVFVGAVTESKPDSVHVLWDGGGAGLYDSAHFHELALVGGDAR